MTLPTRALYLTIIVIISTSTRLLSAQPNQIQGQEPEEVYHPPRQPQICDPDHCDSIVNKCRLTDRCSCEWKKDARCSKDCIDCLEEKFGKCCGCVGLCPRIDTQVHASHVGSMAKNESDQALFQLLTDSTDIHKRWISINISEGHILNHPVTGDELEFAYRQGDNNRIDISHDESFDKMNCIVAFINRQLSMSKCKSYCVSMGASSFRWFYEGCCECIGQYCMSYGLEQPRCIID